jgi:hypothetical protein
MEDHQITVVVAYRNTLPFVTSIPNTLEAAQDTVGGYVEQFTAGDLLFWVNEDGKNNGMPFNRLVSARGMTHAIMGPILVTSCDEEGDSASLSEDQVARALKILGG